MKPLYVVAAVSLLLVAVACLPQNTRLHEPIPSEKFPFHKVLDKHSNFHLFWKVNVTHITFETHVKTWGYVGFGLSAKGKMFPADVVTGWVKNGTAYFQDRHTIGHFAPVIDQSQDWFLLHGEENDFGTVLKMVRKLDTCDDNDYKITEDTVRGLYSYHPEDPSSEDALVYHGVNHRGSKSLMLLSELKTPSIPADAISRDLLNDRYHVPSKYTTYHCIVFDLSDIGRKHHLVKFEPVVQDGHEALVHHIVLYKCPNMDKQLVGMGYECYETHNKTLTPCGNVYLGWAVGGETFYFPEDVGMSLGDPGDNALYILETHYNNPEIRDGFVDSSGIRITYTPTLRQHDAGVFTAGIASHPFLVIPPHEPAFVASSICRKECLNWGLKSKPDGVNVFAVWQHGHLMAEGIKTRLIRNGVEQEPLVVDDQYDFDYQDYRHLHKTRKMFAGDSLLVECTYDSSRKTNVTHGGLSTSDEMCLSFIFYYPRMDVDLCSTIPLYNATDINDYKTITSFYNVDYSDPANRQMFRNVLADSNHLAICISTELPSEPTAAVTKITAPTVPYQPPPSSCDSAPTPIANNIDKALG